MHIRILKWLKWSQIALALITLTVLVVVFFPSVELLLAGPLGLTYLVVAIRASPGRLWSKRLSFLMSSVVALGLSAMVYQASAGALQYRDSTEIEIHRYGVDHRGNLVDLDTLPPEMKADVIRLPQPQRHHSVAYWILLSFVFGLAWSVLVMHVIAWRQARS